MSSGRAVEDGGETLAAVRNLIPVGSNAAGVGPVGFSSSNARTAASAAVKSSLRGGRRNRAPSSSLCQSNVNRPRNRRSPATWVIPNSRKRSVTNNAFSSTKAGLRYSPPANRRGCAA